MTHFNKRMRPLLGTFVEISISKNTVDFDLGARAVFSVIENVQQLLSFHSATSDLTRLNCSDGQWVLMNPISIVALRLARHMTKVTGGLFNFTVGGQLVLDGFLPNHKFTEVIAVGKAEDLEIKGLRARLRRRVILTLDGIAKGYAVDLAVKKLNSLRILSGCINAGGDLRIFGKDQTVPVHRREHDGKLKLLGSFSNTALATSQKYQKDLQRFPGCIVSGTNQVLHDGMWSVTAPRAWLADALTKVACNAEATQAQLKVIKWGGKLL